MNNARKTSDLRDRRRNFAIFAHIDAGKTTLSERMLLAAGAIRKAGEVHDGQATMDSMELERERGITINSAAIRFEFSGFEYGLIDTPGHVDFSMEVERSIRAVETAVLAVCAVAGAQPQTEGVHRRIAKARLPCIAAINKMDRPGADFAKAVASLRSKLGLNAIAIAEPLWIDGRFAGSIDFASASADVDGAPRKPTPEQEAAAAAGRARLVEALAEAGSEPALEWFASGRDPGAQELRQEIAWAAKRALICPALPCAAYKGIGVEALLEAVGLYGRSPAEAGFDPEGPMLALVFKSEKTERGERSFAKLCSGRLAKGERVEAAACGKRLPARIAIPRAAESDPAEQAIAGDVFCIEGAGLPMGETLRQIGCQTLLERIEALPPLAGWRVEPASKAELAPMREALARMCRDDPSLSIAQGDSGETILWGQGDLHLEVALERLGREHGIRALAGAPQIPYAFELAGSASAWGAVDKQTGGKGQFAKALIALEPAEGKLFESRLAGEAVPRRFVPAIERGARAAMECLGDIGAPALGFKAVLLDGQSHSVDSSEMAFEKAGFEAAKAAALAAGLRLMEPAAELSLEAAAADAGALASLVGSIGGRLLSVESDAGASKVLAQAKASKLHGFLALARSATSGRARMQAAPAGHWPA